jgi:hypothetical protein
MSRPTLRLLLICVGLLVSARDLVAAVPLELRVMTYNLRFASTQSPNAWPDRRPVMQALINREAPDVFGTQEGLYGQLRDLAAGLPAYEWIGLGRAGGSKDEFAAVFYRRDRLEPVAFDHFWLSDTPEVIGSITWGHTYRRMVTWVRFRDRATGREFEFWNTHFDHQVEEARQRPPRSSRTGSRAPIPRSRSCWSATSTASAETAAPMTSSPATPASSIRGNSPPTGATRTSAASTTSSRPGTPASASTGSWPAGR